MVPLKAFKLLKLRASREEKTHNSYSLLVLVAKLSNHLRTHLNFCVHVDSLFREDSLRKNKSNWMR